MRNRSERGRREGGREERMKGAREGGREGGWEEEMKVLNSAIWQLYPSIFLPAFSSKSCSGKRGREGGRIRWRTELK